MVVTVVPAPMSLIHNERVKLLATGMHNIGLAFIVAGFVAPAVSGQLHGGSRALVTLAWISLGVGIHLCAQLALGRLRE